MFSEFIRARLWLGLAAVALTGGGQAASIFDIRAAGQTAAPSWLETVVLGGPSQDGVLAVPDDKDYFRIDVTRPTYATIYTSGPVDTTGRLYDPDGLEMAEDEYRGEGSNFRIPAYFQRPGTYILQVELSRFAGINDTGTYTLHTMEQLESPNPLSLAGPPQEGAISTDNEIDIFQLQVAEPTWVTLYTAASFDSRGTLLDPDGRVIAENDDGGEGVNFRIEEFLSRRGTYSLVVESFSSYSTGSYTLHAERGEVPRSLSLGGSPLEGSIEAYGESDRFRLQVTDPTVAIIYTTGGLNGRGTLLDSDGRELAMDVSSGEGRNFRIEATLSRPGTYFLQVELAYSWYDPGSYTLHAERGESLGRLSLGGSPQQGLIGVSGEVDYYLLDVSGPTRAAIYTTGGFDSVGSLLDPDGREIAEDDDGGRRSELSHRVPPPTSRYVYSAGAEGPVRQGRQLHPPCGTRGVAKSAVARWPAAAGRDLDGRRIGRFPHGTSRGRRA